MKGNVSMSKCGVSDILENKVTAITDEATDEQYPTAKAVYDAIIAGAPAVVGRYMSYDQSDVRLRSDGWLGYVKSDSDDIYFRFENPLIASDNAFIFRMWIDSDEVYQIRINAKGDCVIYRGNEGTIPLSGEFVGQFDKSAGYIELRLGRAIVGLTGAKYLRLTGNSVLSTGSFGEIAKFAPFDAVLTE